MWSPRGPPALWPGAQDGFDKDMTPGPCRLSSTCCWHGVLSKSGGPVGKWWERFPQTRQQRSVPALWLLEILDDRQAVCRLFNPQTTIWRLPPTRDKKSEISRCQTACSRSHGWTTTEPESELKTSFHGSPSAEIHTHFPAALCGKSCTSAFFSTLTHTDWLWEWGVGVVGLLNRPWGSLGMTHALFWPRPPEQCRLSCFSASVWCALPSPPLHLLLRCSLSQEALQLDCQVLLLPSSSLSFTCSPANSALSSLLNRLCPG